MKYDQNHPEAHLFLRLPHSPQHAPLLISGPVNTTHISMRMGPSTRIRKLTPTTSSRKGDSQSPASTK